VQGKFTWLLGKTAQPESKEYFCREYSLTTSEAFISVSSFTHSSRSGPPTSKEVIPMDRLSLALILLAWVLIALLSFFVGVIVLRVLRHTAVLTRWTQRGGLKRSSGATNRHG
jgi:ABC-type dipeptide/oligopeptide/nickel transport system permease component